MMVSKMSNSMRLASVAKFPLMRASWSNSALVLKEREKKEIGKKKKNVLTEGRELKCRSKRTYRVCRLFASTE